MRIIKLENIIILMNKSSLDELKCWVTEKVISELKEKWNEFTQFNRNINK